MLVILNALFPVFMIIALGWVLRRTGFPGEDLWPNIDKVTYFIFYPCLLFSTLATAELGQVEILPIGTVLFLSQITMAATIFFTRKPLSLSGPEFSSVFQGSVRWNGFIGLAAAAQLYGPAGATLVAVAIAFMVPMANVLSVFILTRYASDTPASPRDILKTMSRNPLIIACVLGILSNATGFPWPDVLYQTTNVLGRAALTLGLLAVGGGLVFGNIASNWMTVGLTTVLKLLIMPVVVAIYGTIIGIEGLTLTVAILCGSVPGATSSYILARQLGGDATLMASLITASTVIAMISMPFILYLANS